MPIPLKLDTAAVDRLIGEDPQVRIDLQRAVVANVVRKALPKDAGRDINGLIRDAAENLYKEVTSETRQQLENDAAVAELMRRITADEIDTALRRGQASARSAFGPALIKQLQDYALDLATKIVTEKTPEITAAIEERLQSGFERRLAKMEEAFSQRLAGLEEAWKAEAANKIHTDVVARLNLALSGKQEA